MTVHFIGAGPGAADLITLRGRRLIENCPVCLYAGSLVPREILAFCPAGARLIDTAPLDLDAIMSEFSRAHAAGQDVARLHSGDLSIWSAVGEQLRRLNALQSVVLTRTSGRASSMPDSEQLSVFAASRATLAIHLSIHAIDRVVEELVPSYGADCPVAVVWRASWPDERVLKSTLGEIVALVKSERLERTALILVGRVLGTSDFRESALYAAGYDRRFRRRDDKAVGAGDP
jgi:precorrin-4/cobalt-precorrin-4 C11-methyltransferase